MDEAEVDRLRKEAEKFAEQDKELKEQVQVRNELDSMVYQCQKQLDELGDKAPADLKGKVEELLSDTKKILEKPDASLSELTSAKDSLQKSFEDLGQEAYKQGAAAAGPNPDPQAQSESSAESPNDKKKDDDIVDADFEVVDDEKGKD
jgi:molecular chaperone DnaK